jgi:hypothetical protein
MRNRDRLLAVGTWRIKQGAASEPHGVVYKVKTNVDKFPSDSTRYYTLSENNGPVEVFGRYNCMMYPYEEYFCDEHDVYFKVDLFNDSDESDGLTKYNPRLYPFTKENDILLEHILNG